MQATVADKIQSDTKATPPPPANIAEVPKPKTQARTGQAIMPLVPTTVDECWQMAKCFSMSGVFPNGYPGQRGSEESTATVFGAIQAGATVGIPPVASLSVMMIINGRYAMYGDGQLSVVKDSGQLEYIKEFFEGDEPEDGSVEFRDSFTAVCVVKRRGSEEVRTVFTVADAKRAQLWGKTGRNGGPTPWVTYPKRMLKYRARSFALRDEFPDVLLGLQHSAEELIDGGDLFQQEDGSYVAPPPPSREDFREPESEKEPPQDEEPWVLHDEFGEVIGEFLELSQCISAATQRVTEISDANGAISSYRDHNADLFDRFPSARDNEDVAGLHEALNAKRSAEEVEASEQGEETA